MWRLPPQVAAFKWPLRARLQPVRRMLLTSNGIRNESLRSALADLVGKRFAAARLVFIPTAAVAAPNARFPGDYRQVILRVPAKLDATLMREPRAIQGVPKVQRGGEFGRRRKPLSGIGIAS